MPAANQPAKRRSTGPLAMILIIVLGTAAVSAALWTQYFRPPNLANPQVNLAAMGFRAPVSNKLDPTFTDADSDLVADAPTNPALPIESAHAGVLLRRR